MTSINESILIIDDDRSLCEILANVLDHEGYKTDCANNGKKAFSLINTGQFGVVLLDLKLPDMSGLKILEYISNNKIPLQVIMISGQGTINTAVDATRMGAFDFLEKPLDSERVLVTIKNAIEKRKLEREKNLLLESMKQHYEMVGISKGINNVKELIKKAAESNSKVLIEGENGTGKELVARAIYFNSTRAGEQFVAVNCAAIPESLIESELFGHKKGAFTGAVAEKVGKFKQADGGTLFLDEVGDMSLLTQAKVLRVLEEGLVEAVGGDQPVSTDVRIIAATNKNLQKEMNEGRFREDLYYRLNVLNIKVPPLRSRKKDIPALVSYFIKRSCLEHGIAEKEVTSRAMSRLVGHSWPGNVRELKNFIEKMIFMVNKTKIQPQDVTNILQSYSKIGTSVLSSMTLKEARQEFEKEFIRERLVASNGNVTRAAQMLDIPRTYLHKKMKKYAIEI